MTHPSPQPMQLRRGGARRGDHGTFVSAEQRVPTTESEPSASAAMADKHSKPDVLGAAPELESIQRAVSVLNGSDDTGTASSALARAKAAYDAKPKVIFRGIDAETNDKLRGIYKHQLHRPGGIEGWSEWGRSVLAQFVADYEAEHGTVEIETASRLRPGRVSR